MGKWIRNLLILALILLLAGGGCVIGGLVFGVSSGEVQELADKFMEYIKREDFMIQIDPEAENKNEVQKNEENLVFHYQKDEVHQLEIDITKADLTIRESFDDQIHVDVFTDNKDDFQIRMNQGILKMEYANNSLLEDKTAIEISVPKGLKLMKADLVLGAGICKITTPLQADEFDVECGAAVFESVGALKAQYFNLETGAGKVVIPYLDAENIYLENGAGKTEVGIAGTKEQYDVKIEVAAGKVTYADEVFSGVADEYTNRPKDAAKSLEVECAAGSTVITFMEGI